MGLIVSQPKKDPGTLSATLALIMPGTLSFICPRWARALNIRSDIKKNNTPMAFSISSAAVASTSTELCGSLRLPSRSTVAAMSSARSPGCNLKPTSTRQPQARFCGNRLIARDRHAVSALAHVHSALRVLPVLSSCSPPLRNGKAAGRGMLGQNHEF